MQNDPSSSAALIAQAERVLAREGKAIAELIGRPLS
jgi:hypothetical protein